MAKIRNAGLLLAITLGIPLAAWSQGGRAGRGTASQTPAQQPPTPAPAQQAPAANPAAPGGRGFVVAPATSEFFDFDASAGLAQPISDASPVETHQKISVGGQSLAYTARVGFLPLRNATSGQVLAHLFYTCYAKDGVTDAAARPLVFFFGGAPGVAATWQEFGGLGPKRVRHAGEGEGQSNTWVDNPNTLLGQADLVFVNPVGTAFSRPDHPDHGPAFWNTAADIASLGEFVRSFVGRNNRATSPLFLAGEDFGTGRVAGLAAYLHEHQVPVQGVVLLSMSLSADSTAGDAQYITLLPSLIMTSWYHKKLAPELSSMSAEQIAGQARQFASREYLQALYKGDRMTADERTKVVADMARLTGLSKAFLVSNDLRVSLDRFNTELMRDQHRGFSPSDARVTGFLAAPTMGGRGGGGGGGFGGMVAPAVDFNVSTLSPALATGYQSYLRNELTYASNPDGIFYLNSGGVINFTSTGNDDANLASAFARNPNLRLFVGVNYFDLSAPFYATEFTLAHLNVSPEVRAHNITVSHLEAGRMAYLDTKELSRLQRELSSFLTEAAGPAKR